MGAVCPLGRTVEELWNNLLEGKTSIHAIPEDKHWRRIFPDYDIRIGSLFDDFIISGRVKIKPKELKRIETFVQFALDASEQAVSDSGFLENGSDEIRDRTGVLIGVGFGGIKAFEEEAGRILEKVPKLGNDGRVIGTSYIRGMDRVSPLVISKVIPNSTTGNIARYFGFHATECPTVASSCAAGSSGIVYAYKSIVLGDADIMLAGGSEEGGSIMACGCFGNMKALSKRNNEPERASRPFDRDRDGFVIGEGAGILVLEELEHAKKRNAKIYAELLGYGATNDAYHQTHPEKDAKYQTIAINHALKRAGLNPEDIGYINAHGTSTELNDSIETLAIKQALDNHAKSVLINSTKSMIGHCFGGAGGLEAIVAIKSIISETAHPTKNLDNKDEKSGCDLGYCNETKKGKIDYALSNSFGFEGHNVVLAFGKYRY
jgi:3-oxoacyl-[acyl-carrier-protein] synthase II